MSSLSQQATRAGLGLVKKEWYKMYHSASGWRSAGDGIFPPTRAGEHEMALDARSIRKVVAEREGAKLREEISRVSSQSSSAPASSAAAADLDAFNLLSATASGPAVGARAVEREEVQITAGDRSSAVQTRIESDRSLEFAQAFIDANKKGGDEPSLGNEPEEPGPRERRDIDETGIFDATDVFGDAPSEKEQLGKALGLSDEEIAALPGDGTPYGRDKDDGPGGLWGLGGGGATDTSAWTGISNEREHQHGGGKDGIAQTGGISGAAPVGYDDDEGVRGGKGLQDLAEKYKDAPSVSPDQMKGGLGDAMRQAMIAVDELGSEKHVSKDGKVESLKMSDGTIIVSNKDNGTRTVMKKDGSTTTTDASGKVIDKSDPTDASQPSEEGPQELPDGVTNLHSAAGAGLRPYVGSGDVDPVEEGEQPTTGEVEERDPVEMFGQPATEAGFDRVRQGTPGMPGMPGEVDPNEDDSWSTGAGPEDDPLGGMNNPGLENALRQPEEEEEEQDEGQDDE